MITHVETPLHDKINQLENAREMKEKQATASKERAGTVYNRHNSMHYIILSPQIGYSCLSTRPHSKVIIDAAA